MPFGIRLIGAHHQELLRHLAHLASRGIGPVFLVRYVPPRPRALDPLRSHQVIVQQHKPGLARSVLRGMFAVPGIKTRLEQVLPGQERKTRVPCGEDLGGGIAVAGVRHDRPGSMVATGRHGRTHQAAACGCEVQDHRAGMKETVDQADIEQLFKGVGCIRGLRPHIEASCLLVANRTLTNCSRMRFCNFGNVGGRRITRSAPARTRLLNPVDRKCPFCRHWAPA